MGEDSRVPPLSRRVPGETGQLRPARPVRPAAIPEETLRRVLRAFEASREQERAAPSPAPPHNRQASQAPPAPQGAPGGPAAAEASAVPEQTPAPGMAYPSAPGDGAARATIAARTAVVARPAVRARPIVPGEARRLHDRRHRLAGALLSVVVVLVFAAVAAGVLAREVGSTENDISPASSRAAAGARSQAAAWVTAEVSRTAVVSCDPVMCQALRERGYPADRLLELGQGRGIRLRSEVIVATPTLRGILGSRLGSVYAPTVIASFGVGSVRVDVRVTAPRGAAAYRSALAADVAARRASGAALLRSERIVVSAAARRELAAGQVDPRLLITIVGLAARTRISVAGFGGRGPGASPGVPLRSAILAETRNVTGRHLVAYQRSLLAFLRAQRRYLAALIRPMRVAGQQVVRIAFDAPSPLGLLAPGSSRA